MLIFFAAKDEEKFLGQSAELARSCLAAAKLELKVGAQVMLIKNWYEKGLVNGSQGVVISFVGEEQNFYPLVKFTDGQKLVIREHVWEKFAGYNAQNKPIVSATRTQIPLILAWAITIHKSQGQSIERLKVDLNGCFMSGQVYTALSRATNPNYLQILNFSYSRLWCDQKVRDFYEGIIGQVRKKAKPNWHKKYLLTKSRKKFKEFLTVYQQTQEWPYASIQEWLNQQTVEYQQAFQQVVEKTISNAQNLVSHRQLLATLSSGKSESKNLE